MAAKEPISVTLIGVGLVGTSFLHQLLSPSLSTRFRFDLLANSRYALHLSPSASRTPQSLLSSLPPSSSSSPTSSPDSLPTGYTVTPTTLDALISSLPSRSTNTHRLLIDCTSSPKLADLYPAILAAGFHLVTPNKKATSGKQDLYDAILDASAKSGTFYYGEATVGAGLPILGTFGDLIKTGDEVTRVEGILSGTLSYIFNEFSKPGGGGGGKFSEIVKVAKDNGYTEPNPADDLSGSDVARKLTILARLSSPSLTLPEGFASVPTDPLVPESLLALSSPDEFMAQLPSAVDDSYAAKREAAAKDGKVLRYVGSIDVGKGEVRCGLQTYPNSHPFATLTGSDNILSIFTKRYGGRPLIIQGAGAGADVTAMGVTADCIRVAERLRI